jgi:hypothetical protein
MQFLDGPRGAVVEEQPEVLVREKPEASPTGSETNWTR